tara:strand:+ start:213 stop:680 length:468 start_codon:yes stop_codon:yes gene_type:complete
MKTQRTSLEIYHKIKDGLLPKRRFQVYDIIYKHGPLTLNQILTIAQRESRVLNTGAYSGRISELVEHGVIEDVGTTECPVSGNSAILWEATDKLPMPLKRKEKKVVLQMWEGFSVAFTRKEWIAHIDKAICSRDVNTRAKGYELLKQLNTRTVRK